MQWFAPVVAALAATLASAGCGRIDFHSVSIVPLDASGDAAVSDATAPDTNAIDPCAASYAYVYGQSHYRFATAADRWDSAEHACEADGRGSHLVVFNDSPEMNAIEGLAGTVIWIGLSDRVTDGTFLDVMGEIPLFKPQWQSMDPSFPGPGCVQFTPSSRLIHDQDCTTQLPYVCECDGVPAKPSSY